MRAMLLPPRSARLMHGPRHPWNGCNALHVPQAPTLPAGLRWSTSGSTLASSAIVSETTTLLRNLDNGAEAGIRSIAPSLPQAARMRACGPPRKLTWSFLVPTPQIFLIGTAHVSRQSAEEVKELLSVVQPGTIMLELCEQRAERLRSAAKVLRSRAAGLWSFSCSQRCIPLHAMAYLG